MPLTWPVPPAPGALHLSVVIPARNAAVTLPAQLDALLAQRWDREWEVVVVDNGSTDSTRALVERYRANDHRVRVASAAARAGVAHCRNVGVAAARSEAIAMCDADDLVADGWVRAMGDALRTHDFVTGPLDVDLLNPPWVTETRGRAFARGPGDFHGLFPFAHSCNLGFRRSLVRQLGPFDERLAAGEDVDWSLRAWRAGIELSFVDAALVHYRYRHDLAGLWRQARAYGRVQSTLVRRVRAAGGGEPALQRWRSWLWLVRHVGMLPSREGRARWVWVAGGRIGELEGAWRPASAVSEAEPPADQEAAGAGERSRRRSGVNHQGGGEQEVTAAHEQVSEPVSDHVRVDLSIIVPARDVADTLGEQLDALTTQEWHGTWEIVVVDNLSTDGTAALAREWARHDDRIRVVEAPARDGLCYARAVGIAAASADAIAICDGDDVVSTGWMRAMGDALREHPCVTGPLEVDRLNPPWLAETRGRPDRSRSATWFGRFPLVSGGNLGLRREVWEKLGGFDDTYLGAEDAEFSLRLFLAGVAVHFEPDALVHYRYRAAPRVLWRQGNTYGFARPRLRRRAAAVGLRPPPRVAGWRSWTWLLVHLPELRTPHGRARWSWVAGVRAGHVRGSIAARTLFL